MLARRHKHRTRLCICPLFAACRRVSCDCIIVLISPPGQQLPAKAHCPSASLPVLDTCNKKGWPSARCVPVRPQVIRRCCCACPQLSYNALPLRVRSCRPRLRLCRQFALSRRTSSSHHSTELPHYRWQVDSCTGPLQPQLGGLQKCASLSPNGEEILPKAHY